MSRKSREKIGDYYIGLDMGTESVGWAVTDLDYNLCTFNKKNMWGTRILEEAKTAVERRGFRCNRRRNDRKKQRIGLLQQIFAEEIAKKDEVFFLRLKESKFLLEDKKDEVKQKYTLFNDGLFTDREYYEKYPTIYHLRKAIIENKEKYDIRLYYLAIHHIMKNRGHFLFEGLEGNVCGENTFKSIYNELNIFLKDEYDIDFEVSNIDEMEKILKDKSLNITTKSTKLRNLFDGKNKQRDSILKLLSGSKVKLKDIFGKEEADFEEVKDMQFSSANCDENIEKMRVGMPENVYLIEKLKAIYDWSILVKIIGIEKYLSCSKVKDYEKHKKDLQILKKFVRENCTKEDYKNIFMVTKEEKKSSKSSSNCNYVAYVRTNYNYTKENKGKEKTEFKAILQEEFCKFVKKIIENKYKEHEKNDTLTEDMKYMWNELEKGTLCPKQVTKENGVIPYQLNKAELEKILENMEKHYEFLNKEEDGVKIKEKIMSIFEFRIPYYVGPLNDAHKNQKGSNCWVKKRIENAQVYPWNFEQVVDKEASAEEFIRRMTNKCTYLMNEDVIPKNSLIYSEYILLNELNNIKINDEKISVELKQKIYNDMFKSKREKVTLKKLKEYLFAENYIGKSDEVSGIDINIKGNLNSYHDMFEILGNRVNQYPKDIEDIILGIVLFGDDKTILKERLQKKYGENSNTLKLTKDEINKISQKKYTGWSRLSKEFLCDLRGIDEETGEENSILGFMRNNNCNLMELLSSKFSFGKEIIKYNNKEKDKEINIKNVSYDDINELYVSPAVKRMIWQSICIVKELVKIIGHEPKKVFIEMAREHTNDGRTVSRKNKLIELYNNFKDEVEKEELMKELNSKEDSDLRSQKLYLYFTQMGKCMYSGEKININELENVNIYDRDHIYPQSILKDDSIENNLVLVKKSINSEKSNELLPREIQNKMKPFWKSLKDKGLITKIKYERLTRREDFSEQDRAGFINRQIVETRQSTKAVAQIMERMFDKTEIVYVKAGNVSNFRREYEFVKVREINDYHHAQDAYLNIVVGNVYNVKFTKSPINYIKGLNGNYRTYNLNKMFNFDVERNGIVAWKRGSEGTIKTVKNVLEQDLMKRGSIQFTQQVVEKKGGLFDQQLLKKGKGQLPIKSNDKRLSIEKYGGYNSVSVAYFTLIESKDNKGNLQRTIEAVPVYLVKQIENDKNKLIEYCKNTLNLIEPRIILNKIKINTLFVVNGYPEYLRGKTDNMLLVKNAVPLCINKEEYVYLKKICKYIDRYNLNKNNFIKVSKFDEITNKENVNIYDMLSEKHKNEIYIKRQANQSAVLEKGREKFEKLTIEEQCVVLYEMLKLFYCKSVTADLRLIGGTKTSGKMRINKKINNMKSVKIINQSVTGLFQKEIDLLNI